VIAITTTIDEGWNNLATRPVFLPLVHQLVKYLARYEPPSAWQTVGQVIDLPTLLKSRADRIVITPSGERLTVSASAQGLVELNEHGVYEIHAASNVSGPGTRVAVNIDPAESDLTPLDPAELVAAATGRATQRTGVDAQEPTALPPEDAERQQGLWWFLLVAGLVLLGAETVVSNRLSRHERFL
jgi:hypothetical protein